VPQPDDIDDASGREPGPDRRVLLAAAGAAVLVVVLLAVAMSRSGTAPTTTVASGRSTTSASTTTTTAPPTTTVSPTSVSPTTTTAPPPPTEPPPTAPPAPPPTEPIVEAAPAPPVPVPATAADVAGAGAYCLGDSVMLGASSAYFGTITMCGEVDAVVGRQASAGAGVLQAHGGFPDTVVIHLGTNGPTSAGELDGMLGTVAAVPRVVLVNVQLNGSRDWESSVNGELAAAAGRWGNVQLADWYGASAGHPEYFRDGIHLTAAGAGAYAAAIAAAF
jgi:lysophospholipase L1-like esterase